MPEIQNLDQQFLQLTGPFHHHQRIGAFLEELRDGVAQDLVALGRVRRHRGRLAGQRPGNQH